MSKHYWTYEENYLCCKMYYENFVLKTVQPASMVVDELQKLLPNICYSSLRMKMQNIKYLCSIYHIDNSYPIKPLCNYSEDNLVAFKKVFNV